MRWRRCTNSYSRWLLCVPDGRLIVAGTAAGGIKLTVWAPLPSEALAAELLGPNTDVTSICLVSGQPHLLLSSSDDTVYLHDLSGAWGGARILPLRRYHLDIGRLSTAVSVCGGRRFVACHYDRVYVWDAATGAFLYDILPPPGARLRQLAAVSDDAVLCVDGEDLVLCDVAEVRQLWRVPAAAEVEVVIRLRSGAIALGRHDGHVEARACDTGAVLWDCVVGPVPPECYDERHRDVRSMAQLSDGRLVVLSVDSCLSLLDPASATCDIITHARRTLGSLCELPDGGVAASCHDGRVLLLHFTWERRTVAVVAWVAARL